MSESQCVHPPGRGSRARTQPGRSGGPWTLVPGRGWRGRRGCRPLSAGSGCPAPRSEHRGSKPEPLSRCCCFPPPWAQTASVRKKNLHDSHSRRVNSDFRFMAVLPGLLLLTGRLCWGFKSEALNYTNSESIQVWRKLFEWVTWLHLSGN